MRSAKSKPDLAADLQRLEEERATADAALQRLVSDRGNALLCGTADDVIEIDRRQCLEMARVEAADARIVQLRSAIANETQKTAQAARVEAYRLAERSRQDGITAIEEISAHLAAIAKIRPRLIKSKEAVATANRNLPPGFDRLVDPEGALIERGWPSLLDKMAIPQGAIA